MVVVVAVAMVMVAAVGNRLWNLLKKRLVMKLTPSTIT